MPRGEKGPQNVDDEFVIVALWQSGDGDDPNDTCSTDGDGKPTTVGTERSGVEQEDRFDGAAEATYRATNTVRTLLEATNDSNLSLNPCVVVGRRTRKRHMEDLLGTATNIDGDDQTPVPRRVDERCAKCTADSDDGDAVPVS